MPEVHLVKPSKVNKMCREPTNQETSKDSSFKKQSKLSKIPSMFSLNLLNFRKQRNVISLSPKNVKIKDLKNFAKESDNTAVSSVPNVTIGFSFFLIFFVSFLL